MTNFSPMEGKEPKDRLIFALDMPDRKEIMRLVGETKNEVGIFKIGLEAFLVNGPSLITEIGNVEGKVFLDLKMLDIPATVFRVLAAIENYHRNIVFATIHVFNKGLELALQESWSQNLKILVVTLLTSMDKQDLRELGVKDSVEDYVSRMARRAETLGCDGVIASGQEASGLRKTCGENFLIVSPGIRPKWAKIENDDQKRVVTPEEAIRNGADYIVVGRPISESPDGPVAAALRIQSEIKTGLEARTRAVSSPVVSAPVAAVG